MVERNNHGHAVIRALFDHGATVLDGYDGRPGWLSNVKGKPLLYDLTSQAIRDGACRVRSPETATQLASLSANTLAAPEGLHDDRADAFALAIAALSEGVGSGEASTPIAPRRTRWPISMTHGGEKNGRKEHKEAHTCHSERSRGIPLVDTQSRGIPPFGRNDNSPLCSLCSLRPSLLASLRLCVKSLRETFCFSLPERRRA